MTTIDKIRAEIERRIKSCDATSKTPNQLLWAELSALLPFLDTIEEPVSDDLEEAAIDFADYARKQPKDYAISAIADYDHGCIDGFKAGAEWQKAKMMEGATYNELMELYRAIRDELVKRHRDVPVNIKEEL